MSTSRRSASISSARVGVVSMPVLTHGRTKHASGISALRKRTRYLWLFGLTADHYGVVGSYWKADKTRCRLGVPRRMSWLPVFAKGDASESRLRIVGEGIGRTIQHADEP